MTSAEARIKAGLFERCDEALDAAQVSPERWSIWVPGRIEVLGKHSDYAGGRSLICAMERGICARAASRNDGMVRVVDVVHGLSCEVPLSPGAPVGDGWSAYVAAAARRLSSNFPVVTTGVDIALGSDLPRAAGMSSSSALLITVFIALAKANDLRSTTEFRDTISSREELAAYLGSMENGADFRSLAGDGGVGTLGGSQDHTAILCAEPGKIARYAWGQLSREGVLRMPKGFLFAIGASGVAAEKTGSAQSSYNRAAEGVRHLLRQWNGFTYRNDTNLGAALASGPDAADRLRRLARETSTSEFPAETLERRLEQFIVESTVVVPGAAAALAEESVEAFGVYVDWSQWAAERMLGNQIPETSYLAHSARELGAAAASAFGAGFGGSVWALVRGAEIAAFLEAWEARYWEQFPQHAESATFFRTPAGPSALQW